MGIPDRAGSSSPGFWCRDPPVLGFRDQRNSRPVHRSDDRIGPVCVRRDPGPAERNDFGRGGSLDDRHLVFGEGFDLLGYPRHRIGE